MWADKKSGQHGPHFLFGEPLLQVLSSVSREFRQNINEMFFSQSCFGLEVSCVGNGNGLEDIQDWVSRVGMWRLRHLRDLYVTFKLSAWSKRCEGFAIEFCPKEGMKATHDPDGVGGCTKKDLSAYLDMIVKRKASEKWESTGVIDFFTADPHALRVAVYGRSKYKYEQDEEEEIDERDANQVAYGPSFRKLQATPW